MVEICLDCGLVHPSNGSDYCIECLKEKYGDVPHYNSLEEYLEKNELSDE